MSKSGKEHALVIGKKGKTQLSKQQQTFNRLNQKIKKLRAEVKDTSTFMDDCLAYYSAEIYPFEQRSIPLKTEVVKMLYQVLCNDKTVSKKNGKVIKEIILNQIQEIFCSIPVHEDELKEIFNTLSGEDYEQIANEGFATTMSDTERMFSEMGLDLDLSSIGKDDDMNTVMRKMQELLEKAKVRQEEQTRQKKTKRELNKEIKEKEIETARAVSIKSIYRQLVKALHPDLERNVAIRMEKEELMKELASAYENDDLHTLLKLELNWIQHESNHLESLTDDKLKIYNQLLKEQVDELQMELNMVGQHPRFRPLERFYDFGYLSRQTLNDEPQRLKGIIASLENSIHNLKNGKIKQEINEMITVYQSNLIFDIGLFDDDKWE